MGDEPQPSDHKPAGPDMTGLMASVGGTKGMAESGLPGIAFVTTYTINGNDSRTAIYVALAVAAVLTVMRLVRGETVQYAFSGLIGVGIAAFIVSRTGKAEDFYLPGLLTNLGYGLVFLISILIRRPLIGFLVEQAAGKGDSSWREDPARLRLYSKASWMWVVLFTLRFVVQGSLYLAGALVALGVARVAMGVPLFALAGWLTWMMVRTAPVRPASSPG